jgi:hypothetical protein
MRIRHALVVGLFVPQASSSEAARIHIVDPDWTDIDSVLSEFGPQQIARSAAQVDLAKHFALMGLFAAAAFFGSTPTEDLRALPEQVNDELAAQRPTNGEGIWWRREFEAAPAEALSGAAFPTRFEMGAPRGLVERLRSSADLREVLDETVQQSRTRRWLRRQTDNNEPTRSPLGFEFRLVRD